MGGSWWKRVIISQQWRSFLNGRLQRTWTIFHLVSFLVPRQATGWYGVLFRNRPPRHPTSDERRNLEFCALSVWILLFSLFLAWFAAPFASLGQSQARPCMASRSFSANAARRPTRPARSLSHVASVMRRYIDARSVRDLRASSLSHGQFRCLLQRAN